jgi:PilZ domain
MTESQRALEVMGVNRVEQRAARRRSVHVGGTMLFGDIASVAWVKDISEGGMCVFARHSPRVGEKVRVTLFPEKLPSYIRSSYEGVVIRVENAGAGAAFGVVVRFNQAVPTQRQLSVV